MEPLWMWGAFLALVLVMLALDLGVFHRRPHQISPREAAVWSAVWIGVALLFGVGVHALLGPARALEFYTGWLLEKALSVDNLFVFVLLFAHYKVPAIYQHRVLFWGILGALLMRGVMIWIGAAVIAEFHFVLYLFGAFLLFTGARMVLGRERAFDPESDPVVRAFRRFVPVSAQYHGPRFFVRIRENGALRWAATPLFVVLLLVEATDLVFAVDSIPAVFAVTRDPFIVFTSNILAVLGLRSLYFLLAAVVDRLHYLKPALAFVLVFIGSKMLLMGFVHVPPVVSLTVVGSVLAAGVLASLVMPRSASQHERQHMPRQIPQYTPQTVPPHASPHLPQHPSQTVPVPVRGAE